MDARAGMHREVFFLAASSKSYHRSRCRSPAHFTACTCVVSRQRASSEASYYVHCAPAPLTGIALPRTGLSRTVLRRHSFLAIGFLACADPLACRLFLLRGGPTTPPGRGRWGLQAKFIVSVSGTKGAHPAQQRLGLNIPQYEVLGS